MLVIENWCRHPEQAVFAMVDGHGLKVRLYHSVILAFCHFVSIIPSARVRVRARVLSAMGTPCFCSLMLSVWCRDCLPRAPTCPTS